MGNKSPDGDITGFVSLDIDGWMLEHAEANGKGERRGLSWVPWIFLDRHPVAFADLTTQP